jgi:hypothetical protein
VSLTSDSIFAYSTNCVTSTGTGAKTCNAYPNYATNYFDESSGSSIGTFSQSNIDGYVGNGNEYS